MGVRGDSLRDLYAKGLAVLGLGLLAGAGAVVDYWPSLDVPRVSRGINLPKPALARILRTDNTPEFVTAAAPPVVHADARAESKSREAIASLPALPVAASSMALAFDGGVALGAVTVPFGLHPVASVSAVGREVALSAPEFLSQDESAAADLPPMLAQGSDADDDGFLTGAVKKTGTSILRTGVKTGTSIRDAMRAIGGAVRRAFPG